MSELHDALDHAIAQLDSLGTQWDTEMQRTRGPRIGQMRSYADRYWAVREALAAASGDEPALSAARDAAVHHLDHASIGLVQALKVRPLHRPSLDALRQRTIAALDVLAGAIATEMPPAGPESPAAPREEPAPLPAYPDPRTYMFGFCGRRHHDGSTATDWYPGLHRGQWFGWPWDGEVRQFTVSGPDGPMLVAISTCTQGPWRGWAVLLNHLLAAQSGPHAFGEPVFQFGDGGLRRFSARGLDPSHLHGAFDAPGGQSFLPDGSGDVSASAALRALGFDVEIVEWTPSPLDYERGIARAGKRI